MKPSNHFSSNCRKKPTGTPIRGDSTVLTFVPPVGGGSTNFNFRPPQPQGQVAAPVSSLGPPCPECQTPMPPGIANGGLKFKVTANTQGACGYCRRDRRAQSKFFRPENRAEVSAALMSTPYW